MNGINALFHLGSAVAAGLLVFLMLRLKRQRDLLRGLIRERHLDPKARRVQVEEPRVLLRAFARATNVRFEDSGGTATPARLDAQPLLDLFFKHGLILIRCHDNDIEFHVARGGAEIGTQSGRLQAALGGQVQVKIIG